jgi:predicted HAD superfamily Cof-like phosphohydrolase
MYDTLKGVRAFHETYGLPVKDAPDLSDKRTNDLRIELLREELAELKEALDNNDVVEALDALTDLQYVLDGAYLSLGFHLLKDQAFAEVQRSNMSKLGLDGKPIRRESDGKILKGPNYSAPDLKAVYEAWVAQQANKAA